MHTTLKIITPSAELWDIRERADGVRILQRIERCARISHASEATQTPDSWERFLQAVVLQHGDWSVVEHVSASVLFTVDRGITHEIVRHRLASFTQSSTRFIDSTKPNHLPEFIRPGNLLDAEMQTWEKAIHQSAEAYGGLRSAGCPPQIARSVFPNALAARLVMTCNLRNWRHFLLMRTTVESHPQMREVAIPLLATFKERVPLLFDDIEPLARQAENLRKPR